jgi:uncharacterized membrane protein YjdF
VFNVRRRPSKHVYALTRITLLALAAASVIGVAALPSQPEVPAVQKAMLCAIFGALAFGCWVGAKACAKMEAKTPGRRVG